jgi:hypothetical protein
MHDRTDTGGTTKVLTGVVAGISDSVVQCKMTENTWFIAAIKAVTVVVVNVLILDGLETIQTGEQIALRSVEFFNSWIKASEGSGRTVVWCSYQESQSCNEVQDPHLSTRNRAIHAVPTHLISLLRFICF